MVVLAAALAACSGDAADAPGAGASVEPTSEAERAAGAELQRASMQAGTNWATGALTRFCRGDRCTEDPEARAAEIVRVPDSGLLLFVVPSEPDEARVTIKRSGKAVLRESLRPGTTMPVTTDLRARTRHDVTLIARWGDREARWVFAVRGPKSG